MSSKEKKQNICEVCGKPYDFALTVHYENGKKYCRHDEPSQGKSVTKKRHENELASIEALKMANAHKRADAEAGINKMVPVTGKPQKGYVNPTEMIPESAIKSIEEKVEGNKDFQKALEEGD